MLKQIPKRIYLMLGLLTLLISISTVLHYFSFGENIELLKKLVTPFVYIAISITIAVIGRSLINFTAERAIQIRRTKNLSSTSISALANIVELIFYALVLMGCLQSLGVNVSSLIAVGGIAGLAIGLAAKDLLANIFGGLMIYWDRPFGEGDWVCSPDRNIEGTVSKIGLRITQITSFDNRPVYVPNSVFSSIIIENPSRMNNRRIAEAFSIRYQDDSQVEKIITQIEKMLHQHDAICKQSPIMVHLLGLGDSSLDCQVYCFTKSSNWKNFRNVRQQILLKIIQIIRANGADIPFPTRTLDFSEMPTSFTSESPSLTNQERKR